MRSALLLAVFAVVAARGGCDPGTPYEPCAAKVCGESCRVCPPDSTDCAETAVVKACDASGSCVAEPVDCTRPPYDPCEGKACGEYCSPCAPGAPCPMYFAATACNASGECVTVGTFTCKPPPPLPDPCAGKLCGDACTTCDPAAGVCAAVMMYCDAAGQCGYAFPVCDPAAD